jgi:uncharacterized delta-60 repeat protein
VIAGVPDRTFGNVGTIWSGIPTPFKLPLKEDSHPAYVGGTAVGVHLLDLLGDAPALVVQGWAQDESRQSWLTSALAVVPPPDGAPQEVGLSTGTRLYSLGPRGMRAEPIASCNGPAGTLGVLVRAAGRTGAWDYSLRTVAATGPLDEWRVKRTWLFEPTSVPPSGNVRIALAGGALVIVSTRWEQLCITVAQLGGAAQTKKLTLRTPGKSLRGLTRLTVASVRVWGSTLSVALTAERTDPVVGDVSQGVLAKVRMGSTIALDKRFGNGGLWVSPILATGHGFVCGGETSRGLAGVAGKSAVAFGVLPDGGGLDPEFGVDGVCEVDLGGPLSSPVATNDRNEFIYVFAQRRSDLKTVGCRIRVRTGLFPVPNGTQDPTFGTNGMVTLRLDGAAAEPAAIVAGTYSVAIATTRELRGTDCDVVPVVVALQPADGTPDPAFGAGGFALHGSVGLPAAFAPDGSCIFAGPPLTWSTTVHVTGPDGEARRTIEPSLGVTFPGITSMRWLDDGGHLISGAGWLAKLSASGALDASFGTAGVVEPFGNTGKVSIVDVRTDGRIAVRGVRYNWLAVALLQPDGTLDTTYGDAGFADLWQVRDVRAFPVGDGSLLCVASTGHTPGAGPPWVQIGLQRIEADGSYDTGFGWGPPAVFPPTSGSILLKASGGVSVDDEFAYIDPAGIVTLGGRPRQRQHYMVATGWIGGRLVRDDFGVLQQLPIWPTLVVTRWDANGSPDSTFGAQVAGYSPDRLSWTAVGVLAESSSSLLAFGMAATKDVALDAGRQVTVVRQPQPALFRVSHPGGIDFSFGHGGAAVMRMQEFGPAPALAGVLLANGRVRLAVADGMIWSYGAYPNSVSRLASSYGGLAQFR